MKKISAVLAEQKKYNIRPFALVNHVHAPDYPPSVVDIAARDALLGDQRYEGVIIYVQSDGTTYQLRGGIDNDDWVTLVSNTGATSHTGLADIGINNHTTIDAHLADSTRHFTQAAIEITIAQISDFGSYADAGHDHNLAYLAISAASVLTNSLATTTVPVSVSASISPTIGQVLTAVSGTAAAWKTIAAAGDIIQTGTPINTHIAYFTANKKLSGDAGFTWDVAAAALTILGASPELILKDSDTTAATMLAHLAFFDSSGLVAKFGFITADGNLTLNNSAGDIILDSDVSFTGYINAYAGTPTDGQILRWVDENGRAEFSTFSAIQQSGTPADNQIAVFDSAVSIEGTSVFTWNGSVFIAEDFSYSSVTDRVVIGDGSLSGAGITINASATGSPFINLQQNSVTRAIWKFNNTADRAELSSSADNITIRPGNVDSYIFTQASLTLAGNIIFAEGAVENVNYLQFDIDYSNGSAEGKLQWNSEDGTLEVGMPGGSVNLQIGQEQLIRVRNVSGATIPDGTIVYINGAVGVRPTIALAKADAAATAHVLGITTEDIVNNTNGYVNTGGYVRDVDTLGMTEGDDVYLSASTAGEFTDTKPSGSSHITHVGTVVRVHATEGIIYHHQEHYPHLRDLSGVKEEAPVNGGVLKYVSANNQFELSVLTVPIVLSAYDAEPSRGAESNMHGGMETLVTSQPLDAVPTDIVVEKGIGKILIVINAGSDLVGDILITGESIDRDTGVSTPADTDIISVDAVTTDNSTIDSNGNVVHSLSGAYLSSKWFTGTVTLSTVDLTLTDVSVYHVSFEQFNDSPGITLDTFDISLYTTNISAEFDAYLFTIHVEGSKCSVGNPAALHVGADGETAIANKYWRLRRGGISEPLDGTTDGCWIDLHYSSTPSYVEDVTVKLWATKTYNQ